MTEGIVSARALRLDQIHDKWHCYNTRTATMIIGIATAEEGILEMASRVCLHKCHDY